MRPAAFPTTDQLEAGLSEHEVIHRLSESGAAGPGSTKRLRAVHRLPDARRHRHTGRQCDSARPPPRALRRRRTPTGPGLAARRNRERGTGAGGRPRHGRPPYAHPGPDVRDRPARGDRHTRPFAGGERHVHRAHLCRLAWRRAVQADGTMGSPSPLPRPPRLHPGDRCRDELSATGRSEPSTRSVKHRRACRRS